MVFRLVEKTMYFICKQKVCNYDTLRNAFGDLDKQMFTLGQKKTGKISFLSKTEQNDVFFEADTKMSSYLGTKECQLIFGLTGQKKCYIWYCF